jgi:hypothetical protein
MLENVDFLPIIPGFGQSVGVVGRNLPAAQRCHKAVQKRCQDEHQRDGNDHARTRAADNPASGALARQFDVTTNQPRIQAPVPAMAKSASALIGVFRRLDCPQRHRCTWLSVVRRHTTGSITDMTQGNYQEASPCRGPRWQCRHFAVSAPIFADKSINCCEPVARQ